MIFQKKTKLITERIIEMDSKRGNIMFMKPRTAVNKNASMAVSKPLSI